MAAVRIALFGGIVPRQANRALPDNAAQFALNAQLYSGELRSWNAMKQVATVADGTKSVFHYRHTGLDRYLAFPDFTNVVKAPLVNETLGRLYWTPEAGGAMVNTTARIEAGDPAFKLGVPSPGGTFTVTPSGGTAATAETRTYVATLVTSFGEESAPGAPVLAEGNADGTWTITDLDALTIDTANYPNITTLRLYRTLTSDSGVDFRQVNEWAIGARPVSYVDNVTDTDLSDNTVLESLSWTQPPSGLKGLIGVAGGFMAGFTGRTVRLSVPYYPHAWPEEYSYAVEDDIVGLGTFGNTIVVCTAGRAYLLIGQSPDAMGLQKSDGVQPCLSKRGIVSTVGGVLYPSTDGLVVVDGSSNVGQIISRAWVTKNEWMSRFSPASQMSSVYQDRYFSFYTDQLGFVVGFDDPITGYTELQQAGVDSVDLDVLTGQTLITIGTKVYEWDGNAAAEPLVYQWKSKPFLQAKPVNMAAIQIRGDFVGSIPLPTPPAQGIGGYALNEQAINGGNAGTPSLGGSINGPPAWMALGEAPQLSSPGTALAVKVYADGDLVWFGSVTAERPYRLPSGYKAYQYEIELQGTARVFSVTMADTMKGLENFP